jgi:hypothetical protein
VSHPRALPPEAFPPFLTQLAELGIDHYIAPAIDRDSVNLLLDEVVARHDLVGV